MNDFEELKRLLFGAEKQALDSITERVQTRETRAADVADVLPEALRQSHETGRDLTAALREPVGQCVKESFRTEPEGYADALYPVMGPAIRKAIMNALRSFAQQINETVEHSLSVRGLKWRFEAWRAGVPFGDYVIQRNMLYRVEQAYLISRQNGLLVAHVHHEASRIKDSDAVSAMFTAIQDFVQESFSPDRSGRLETADMGEFTLWAVHGPHALLVCVIRGVPPRRLRGDLSAILERIHFRHGESLRQYAGDTSSMQGVESELRDCLGFEALKPAETGKRRVSLPLAIILLIVIAGLVYLGFDALQNARQERALANALAAAPGFYVDDIEADGGSFVVRGLRDPLAEPLAAVAARAGLEPARVNGDLRPYQSLDPDIVLQRARAAIEALDGVDVRVTGERIVVSGAAPQPWIDSLRSNPALRLLGLPVDLGALAALAPPAPPPADPLAALRGRAQDLARSEYRFTSGADLDEADALRLTEHATAVRELAAAAAVAGARLRIEVIGRTDSSGSIESNNRLAERRAETAARILTEQGIDPVLIRRSRDVPTVAGGAPQPALRQVSILVALEAPDSTASDAE